MKRLTTDNPEGNDSAALNLFYIKDQETWVRGGGSAPDYPDVTLNSWIRGIIKTYGTDKDTANLDDEELSGAMSELLFNGTDTIEGVIATLYAAAWAFSTLRWRLERYENTGLNPEEVAEMKGRMEDWT